MALQMNEPLTGYLAELCTDITRKGAVSGLDAIDGVKVHPILQMMAAQSFPLGRLAFIEAPVGPSLDGLSC